METLARFVVRIADLAEAEGREVRATVFRMLTAAAVFLVAAGVGICGSALLLLSVYWVFEPAGRALAAFASGTVALALGGALVWIGQRMEHPKP